MCQPQPKHSSVTDLQAAYSGDLAYGVVVVTGGRRLLFEGTSDWTSMLDTRTWRHESLSYWLMPTERHTL